MASWREPPHISGCGRSDAHTAGRCGWPNSRQRASASRCGHGMPMEGAMQQAAQAGRQFKDMTTDCRPSARGRHLK